jgi:cellulose synthase (UDP-forming)
MMIKLFSRKKLRPAAQIAKEPPLNRSVRSKGGLGWLASALRWTLWPCLGLISILLLTQPVGVETQLKLSFSVIAAMSLVWLVARGPVARYAFLALGSLVVLRYLYWRLTSTLPPTTDPFSFALGLLLIIAEFYCVMILAFSCVINADPLIRKDLPRDKDEDLPEVDVFIPTYDEAEDILAATVSAAMLMDYPAQKLKVWLLDDGATDEKRGDKDEQKASEANARRAELQKLCLELGANYLSRAGNEDAKAGNLNYGLAHSKAEIIVVFDADHAPFKSFLRETIGHFSRDEKLFLVQTPHVFLNQDPIEKNLKTSRTMPSENAMFYAVTQKGLDKWNGSFFCGSAALLRRSALHSIGGFSGVTITEDCETALELHRRGWTSIYVDKPLIAGLQPDTFSSFISQRSRWCQGMLQILLLKNPVFRSGLKPIQRLAYMSSMSYWLFPLPRLAFMLAPLLPIFFDIKIFVSGIDEAIAYSATYIVVNLMLRSYLYGHVRWPWMSELYEYVQGVFLAKSILSVAVSPRKPTFKVTPKGGSPENDHLSELALPLVSIFALLAVGVGTAWYRYVYETGATSFILVVGTWAAFNLIIAAVALGAVAERRQIDRHPALAVDRKAFLLLDGGGGDHPAGGPTGSGGGGGVRREVSVTNASIAGCSIRIDDPKGQIRHLPAFEHGHLEIVQIDKTRTFAPIPFILANTSRDGRNFDFALAFDSLAFKDYLAVADLIYGDQAAIERFVLRSRARKSLISGSFSFISWGLTEPFRALFYSFKKRPAAELVKRPILLAETEALPIEATDSRLQRLAELLDQSTVAATAGSMIENLSQPTASAGQASTFDQASWMRQMMVVAEEEMDLPGAAITERAQQRDAR